MHKIRYYFTPNTAYFFILRYFKQKYLVYCNNAEEKTSAFFNGICTCYKYKCTPLRNFKQFKR